jgi:acetylornithine/succinyldiaminopimelate/putrescine aminotransferase
VAGALFEAFGKRIRHFNTFGGNPVSCAVAPAVLKVIKGRPAPGAHQRDGHEGQI